MGAAFSSGQLAGASSASPVPVLPTSYAFTSGNTNSFGFTATFSAEPRTDGFGTLPATAVVTQSIVFPLKAGGSTTVACGPATVEIDPAGTSITCPIANTLIGVGTATYRFIPAVTTDGGFRGAETYLIAFTTVGAAPLSTFTAETYPSTVTACSTSTGWEALTSKAPTFKNCRPAKKGEKEHYRAVRRDVAGYGPPDVTYPGQSSQGTITQTVVKTATVTDCANTSKATSSKTITSKTTPKTTPTTTASTTTSSARVQLIEY